MWARVIEVTLGCWLVLSPFIFRHATDQAMHWINDLCCGFAVATLALLSFWHPTRHAHLVTCGIALWLIGVGLFASPYPAPPALQNNIVVGLLLLIFAIIPDEASLPPSPWRDFFTEREKPPARAGSHVWESTNAGNQRDSNGYPTDRGSTVSR